MAPAEFLPSEKPFSRILAARREQVFLDIDAMTAGGSVFAADTLEDLARQFGADPVVLTAEIEKYNSFCENGADTDFRKVKLGEKIGAGPFWASPRRPVIHHTAGLQINEDAQVSGTSGAVIAGFMPRGEVTGGVRAGNLVGGNAIPGVMVFGRVAGRNAAAGK